MIKKLLLLSTSLLWVNLAIADEVSSTDVNKDSIQSIPTTSVPIDFFDAEVFDLKLGMALLSGQPTVEVKIIAPFTVNQIPKRLDVWVSAIHSTGGSVLTKPDPEFVKDRGFISEIFDLVVQAYKEIKDLAVYAAAANYNLTLFYNPKLGTVTKMVFTHK